MPILTLICFALATLGFIATHVFAYRAGLLVFKLDYQNEWREARADPYRAVQLQRATVSFVGGMIIGIMGLFPMIIQDEIANVPCRQACADAGWSDGRLRPSPHLSQEERGLDTPACWCVRDQEWSPEPVLIDAD